MKHSVSTRRSGHRPVPARRLPAAIRAAAAAGALLAGCAAVAGCAQQADASAPIQLGTAYVNVPGKGTGDITDAYLAIRNNGPADQLISARTSVGGQVTFREPADGTVMKTVRDLGIPADALLRLSPISGHLLITGARPMRAGRQITLILVFARSGTHSVPAEVTNPATGGASYFLN